MDVNGLDQDARIRELEEQVRALSARMQQMDANEVPERARTPRAVAPQQTGTEGAKIARRALLVGAVGAVGAAGSALAASPASAAPGQPLIIGSSNSAQAYTTYLYSGAFYVDTGSGSSAAVRGRHEQTLDDGEFNGVEGIAQSPGAFGVKGTNLAVKGPAVGVQGSSGSESGTGVVGKSTAASGVSPYVRGTPPIGVLGECSAVSGRVIGVLGRISSDYGSAVSGWSLAESGEASGVSGSSASPLGTGVSGRTTASTGVSYGVHGEAVSPAGWAVFAKGRLKSTGRTFLGAPASAPDAADLDPNSISFYIDKKANALKVRVKYGNGVVKTGTVELA